MHKKTYSYIVINSFHSSARIMISGTGSKILVTFIDQKEPIQIFLFCRRSELTYDKYWIMLSHLFALSSSIWHQKWYKLLQYKSKKVKTIVFLGVCILFFRKHAALNKHLFHIYCLPVSWIYRYNFDEM